MATVYLARDRRLGREVAVKVIHPHLRESAEVASRFIIEAKAVAKLRHPNIVEVYDVSEAGDREQYLVVELVRGTTLRKLLQERGAMPAEVAAAIALDLASALSHANARGVVHRDVKPENVLVERAAPSDPSDREGSPSGARAVVKLTDFGIAKLLDVQGMTSTGQVLGSPAHMSPEQIDGGQADARSDVFGLGVLLYECTVGHLPFEGSNPAQVLRRVLEGQYPQAQTERPAVGARFSAILDHALARAPEDRFAGADAMRSALAAELGRLGIAVPQGEIEAWLDDPEGYDESRTPARVEKLIAMAGEAQRRGNVVSAAGDYNRALALSPNDARLLKLVAGVRRAEARARLGRRIAWVGGVVAVLGVMAFGAARTMRAHTLRALHSGKVAAAASVDSLSTLDRSPSAVAIPADSGGQAHGHGRSAGRSASPAAREVVGAPQERKLTLDLKPPMGVVVSIDGQPPRAVSTGDVLALDGRSHALSFSCPVCTEVDVAVAAGDKDGTLVASVPIKPATLIIDGSATGSYQLVEHPELSVRAGANMVALRSAFERVTVKRLDTGDDVSVRLEAAKTVHAPFK